MASPQQTSLFLVLIWVWRHFVLTKRASLSLIGKVFIPVGMISPFVIYGTSFKYAKSMIGVSTPLVGSMLSIIIHWISECYIFWIYSQFLCYYILSTEYLNFVDYNTRFYESVLEEYYIFVIRFILYKNYLFSIFVFFSLK